MAVRERLQFEKNPFVTMFAISILSINLQIDWLGSNSWRKHNSTIDRCCNSSNNSSRGIGRLANIASLRPSIDCLLLLLICFNKLNLRQIEKQNVIKIFTHEKRRRIVFFFFVLLSVFAEFIFVTQLLNHSLTVSFSIKCYKFFISIHTRSGVDLS